MTASIYDQAMRTTRARWRTRTADAVHDAVAEAYLRRLERGGEMHPACAWWVAQTAGEILRGRRCAVATQARHEPLSGLTMLVPANDTEAAMVALLDAPEPDVSGDAEVRQALDDLLARGWRGVDLAEACGVAQQTVGEWIHGSRCPRDAGVRRKLIELATSCTPAPPGRHEVDLERAKLLLLSGIPERDESAPHRHQWFVAACFGEVAVRGASVAEVAARLRVELEDLARSPGAAAALPDLRDVGDVLGVRGSLLGGPELALERYHRRADPGET